MNFNVPPNITTRTIAAIVKELEGDGFFVKHYFHETPWLNTTNTVLKIGKNKWYYPEKMDWSKEVKYLEIEEMVVNAIKFEPEMLAFNFSTRCNFNFYVAPWK